MDLKRCSLCCLELTLDHFRRDHTRKDGFHPWCKECQRKKRKEYRNNNPITKEGEKKKTCSIFERERTRNSFNVWKKA